MHPRLYKNLAATKKFSDHWIWILIERRIKGNNYQQKFKVEKEWILNMKQLQTWLNHLIKPEKSWKGMHDKYFKD